MKDVLTKINKDHKLIYVAGASASGKSYFAEQLKAELEKAGKKVLSVSADMYYVDNTRLKHLIYGTFDHPKLIRHDLLAKDIKNFMKTNTINIPEYSFMESRRVWSQEFTGKVDHVIVEWLYTIQELPKIDNTLTFFVDSYAEELIVRRLVRDQQRTGDGIAQIVSDVARVFPMRNIFGKTQRKKADIIITNEFEILEKEWVSSSYKKIDASQATQGELLKKEFFVDYEYNDSAEGNGTVIVSEVYKKKSDDIDYVMITKRKEHITPNTQEFNSMTFTITNLWVITQIHALLQLAGLKLKRTVKKTVSIYDNNGELVTIKHRKGKIYKKVK